MNTVQRLRLQDNGVVSPDGAEAENQRDWSMSWLPAAKHNKTHVMVSSLVAFVKMGAGCLEATQSQLC